MRRSIHSLLMKGLFLFSSLRRSYSGMSPAVVGLLCEALPSPPSGPWLGFTDMISGIGTSDKLWGEQGPKL